MHGFQCPTPCNKLDSNPLRHVLQTQKIDEDLYTDEKAEQIEAFKFEQHRHLGGT